MNKKINKFIVVPVAAAMILTAVPMSACNPDADNYEDGTAVVFNFNDGVSRPYTVYTDDNGNVQKPDEPMRKGYTFSKWSTKDDGSDTVTFPFKAEENTTLYAQWEVRSYNVTFDYNYDESPEPLIVSCKYKESVNEPEEPTRDNWYFYYWMTAPENGSEAIFPYTVTDDTTLYVRWSATPIVKEVYNYNYPSDYPGEYPDTPESVTVRKAAEERVTTSDIKNPSLRGYTFKGWATEKDATASNVRMPHYADENRTLYAVWEQKNCTVSFVSDWMKGGALDFFAQQKCKGAETMEAPETPTRDGYTFEGWYTSDWGGEKIQFPCTIYDSMNVFAHWKHVPVTPSNGIFDAEFVEYDPLFTYPGYSGEAKGRNCIVKDDTNSAHSEPYGGTTNEAHYVSFQYVKGATLRFVINSDKDVSNVTLKASLSCELIKGLTLTIAPTGDYGYSFIVNGQSLDYAPVTIHSDVVGSGDTAKCKFKEYTIATNVSLKQGENIIELVVNNNNTECGGTLKAVGPLVDYIKLEGGAALSWSPVYDNVTVK